MTHTFGSDNHAGVHPQVMAAIQEANTAHAGAYGADLYTEKLQTRFQDIFGANTHSYVVLLGTAANVLCLQSAMRPWHAVVCAEVAHLIESECNAPEKHLGSKVIAAATNEAGKITPETVQPHLRMFGFEHAPQPKVISITQCTEYGTVYTPEEIKALAALAHQHDMYLHMDGARISNAAVHLGLSFQEMTVDCAVDMLSFGGTKNGLMAAEAVLLFHPQLAEHMAYMRKQAMQLTSKMRYLSAQLLSLLENDLWKKNAANANERAQQLAEGIAALGVPITRPVQTNAVFVQIPDVAPLMEQFHFYMWDEAINESRLMCSWDTTAEDVQAFLSALRLHLQSVTT